MNHIALLIIMVACAVGKAQAQVKYKIFPLTTALWKSKTIVVSWDNPGPENKSMRELVREAVESTWQGNSDIKFVGWGATATQRGDIRILIADEEPITRGLGTRISNEDWGVRLNSSFKKWRPTCNTNMNFCIKAIAVHEFGHVLGFAHEQNRRQCKFPDCHSREQGDDGDYFLFRCDSSSIMNYCAPFWFNKGMLSKLDIQGLQYFYGRPMVSFSESLLSSKFKSLVPKFRPPFLVTPLHFIQTANFVPVASNVGYYHVKIYLTGNSKQLDRIQRVVYEFPRKLKVTPVTVYSRKDFFGLESQVEGSFEIYARVYFKDTSEILIKHLVKVDNLPDEY